MHSMLPLATPKSSATAAPNSNAASSIRHRSGVTVMAKNPPPPKTHTVRRNGFSRVQKLNVKSSESPMKGTCACAPSEMLARLNTPMAMSGRARSKPARIPWASTSR